MMSSGNGTVAQALDAWGGAPASGYAVAPRWFRFFRFEGGIPRWMSDGRWPVEEAADLAEAYQVMVFDADARLLWRYDQARRDGRWATLTDAVASERGWRRLGGVQRRLVAGRVSDGVSGWSLMTGGTDARLWVPVAATVGASVALRVVEYVSGGGDLHGNRAVVADRICGWEI